MGRRMENSPAVRGGFPAPFKRVNIVSLCEREWVYAYLKKSLALETEIALRPYPDKLGSDSQLLNASLGQTC